MTMTPLDELLSSLIGAPHLPGARCRGRPHLFDPAGAGENATTVEQRHAQALGLCQRCPALDLCAEWLDSLPRQKKPEGVIAGRLRIPNQVGRPKGTTS
jgi:WhiB family redox-sensing transcriptional regulator